MCMKCARYETKVNAKRWWFQARINKSNRHHSLPTLPLETHSMLNMKRFPISRLIYIGNVGAIVVFVIALGFWWLWLLLRLLQS